MDVVKFLRSKGFTVQFTEHQELLVINGEKSYICLRTARIGKEKVRKDTYIFQKPCINGRFPLFDSLYAVFLDQAKMPCYRVPLSKKPTKVVSVLADFSGKYTPEFIGYIDPTFIGTYHPQFQRRTDGRAIAYKNRFRDRFGHFISNPPLHIENYEEKG